MKSSEKHVKSSTKGSGKNRLKPLSKTPTGIRGLDDSLWGGLPSGRAVVITGTAGSCKTLAACEFLYRGITEYGEPGVLLTLEEAAGDIRRNVASLGWDFSSLEEKGKLLIIDAGIREFGQHHEVDQSYNLTPIIIRIRQAIKQIGAKRVVIDGFSSLCDRIPREGVVRELFMGLCHALGDMNVTTIVTIEKRLSHESTVDTDITQFVADGVIEFEMKKGQQQLVRTMLVKKLRGVNYRSGEVDFDIDADGIIFFPKIPVSRRTSSMAKGRRLSTGIAHMDKIISGGIPRGHIILVSGNTGSGKTTLCCHFLNEGLENGESVIFVSLEEPSYQIIRNARNHGFRFAEHRKSGKLHFIDAPIIDLYPDKLLYDIVNTLKRTGATRLVFDSLSTIESGTMKDTKVREFLFQLVEYAKSRGVTCLFSFLVTELFGAVQGQMLASNQSTSLRLSSVVDGIFLLRYFEREKEVARFLNVLKLRGSRHRKDLFEYTIGRHGIQLESPLKQVR